MAWLARGVVLEQPEYGAAGRICHRHKPSAGWDRPEAGYGDCDFA